MNETRRRGYTFEGTIALDRVVAGVLELPPLVASPAGFDDVWAAPYIETRVKAA